jgi:hypothetical protein
VSSHEEHHDSPAVTLIFGVLAVAGLLYISLIALGGPVWMGVFFGGIELLVAWRITPPVGARALRGITATMGAATVVVAVAFALAS